MEYFKLSNKELNAKEIETISQSTLVKSPKNDLKISKVSGIENGDKHTAVFLDGLGVSTALNRAGYENKLSTLKAGAIFVRENAVELLQNVDIAIFVSKNPRKSFIKLQNILMQDINLIDKGISKFAAISDKAEIEDKDSIYVGNFSSIEAGAKIGKNVFIANNVVIGKNVVIGDNSIIKDGATIRYTEIGQNVVIGEGVRIGSEGFGWASDMSGHVRVPQTGKVIIENFVEIDANSCVDRGTFENTVIGEGTKIDGLCKIAHNVKIGKHSVIAGSCAIAGSVKIGNFVLIGGNSSLAGHITIADGVQIGGMSGVISDISEPQRVVWGLPATDKRTFLKQTAFLRKAIKK